MSLNRDQNVASDTNLLPDIPFKKRKDSRLHVPLSHYEEEEGEDDDDNKKQKKNRRAESTLMHFGKHVAQADSCDKGICGSFAAPDDDHDDDYDDDDDNTVYKNPYLNHVRSNVTSQEGEGSHNLMLCSVPKGSNHMSVCDVNSTGQNLSAQDGYNYFPLSDELCGITSDIDKYPYIFSLTSSESGNERSEIGGTSKIMWPACGERNDSFVSSLILDASSQSSAPVLNEDIAAHAGLSSASHELHKLNSDLLTKKVDHENSGISGDRTSSVQIKPYPTPTYSESFADLLTLKYDLCSENVYSSLSPVGTCGNGQLPASVSFNSMLVTPFRAPLTSSLKLCENEHSTSSKFGTKPKPAMNQTADLSSSTLCKYYGYPSLEFGTHSKMSGNQSDALPLSLKTRSSEPVLTRECVGNNSSSSSPKLSESEPSSSYKCDVDFNVGKQKSGSKFTECGILPALQWKSGTENETAHFPVSEHSNSYEYSRHVERSIGADSSFKNEGKCIKPDSVDVLTKNKLWKFERELPDIMETTPCFEIATARKVDTISKQGPPGSYEGSQGNLEKQVGEDIPAVGHQCQGTETDMKEEHCAVGNIDWPSRANRCILEDSGFMPVKSEGAVNVADHHCAVIQDVNTDGRKCYEEDTAVRIDDRQSLSVEQNKYGSSDREETILVSDDSDNDTITIYDNDGFEETDDDIEIVKCLSKSHVGKRDFSAEQKALDCTKSQARYKNHERKDKNMLACPFEVSSVLNFSKSLVKPDSSSSSNHAGNSVGKQKGDEQLFWWKSVPEANGGSSASAMNASGFQAAKSSCLNMRWTGPTHMPQVYGVYDLSRSTVIQGTAAPSSLSPVHSTVKLAGRRMFPRYGGSNYPYVGRPLDLVLSLKHPSSLDVPFPLSSESTSSRYVKQHGCDRNLVPAHNECEASVWNASVPNASSSNFAAASPESILNIVPNSLEMSGEAGNQEENFVPPKDTSQLMPVPDTPLEEPGPSYNAQEGKEVMKKQQNAVEDKTETAQRSSRPEWECAVCLETISSKRGISATMCGHVYCTPCITEVVCKKKECPTCRRTLDSTQVHPLFISG